MEALGYARSIVLYRIPNCTHGFRYNINTVIQLEIAIPGPFSNPVISELRNRRRSQNPGIPDGFSIQKSQDFNP